MLSADAIIPLIIFVGIVILHVLREQDLRARERAVPSFEVGAASTFGDREIQQDYFGVKNAQGALLMTLADGIGAEGEFAAKIAVDTFRELFNDANSVNKPQYFFQRAANAAHQKITNALEERQGETSIAAAIVNGGQLFYTLAGNCRVTVFRGGDLIPVSEGQTVDVLARHRYHEGRISKQETLALMENHRRYNVLGQDSFREIELFDKPLVLKPDDLVVVMSAGVFETLRWVELEEVLAKKFAVQLLADEIISLVNKSAKLDKDNASILICRQK